MKEEKQGSSYDSMHRLLDSTNPSGQKTSYSYDSMGNLANVLTPNGYKTSYEYDALDRITKQTNPEGKVEEYSYDIVGNIDKIVKNGGRTTSFAYDNLGNVTEVTNALSQKTSYLYNNMNKLTSETDASGQATLYSYDLNSRLVQITGKNGGIRKLTYDGNNNVISMTDPENRKTIYTYDLANRLTGVTDGENVKTAYKYDSVGNLISKTDGEGNETSYKYDLAGRLTKITNPLSEAQQFTYDIAGRLSSSQDANGTIIKYDYDKLDALVSKDSSDKNDGLVLYAYDSEGRKISMKDVSGSTNYEYDSLGRIKAVKTPDGNKVLYSYDDYGNLSELTYPDGKSVSYKYDELDRLTDITDRNGEKTTYKYDLSGNMIEVDRPNGSKTISEYNELGAVNELINYDENGQIISSYEYKYDLTGLVTREIIKQNAETIQREYSYNQRNELIYSKETSSGNVTEAYYSYDKLGNRIMLKKNENSKLVQDINYSYDKAGKLLSENDSLIGQTQYIYDSNGNVIKKIEADDKIVQYDYTTDNRLKAVKENGSLLMAALYDGDGNRIFAVNKRSAEYKEEISLIGESNNSCDNQESNQAANNSITTINGTNGMPQGTANFNAYNEKIFSNPQDSIFWYGFSQSMINGFSTASAYISQWFNKAWTTITDRFTMMRHTDGQSDDDGEPEQAFYGTTPQITPQSPSTISHNNETIYDNVLIPYGIGDKQREDYDITSYVNNVNTEYTQVLMEYGSSGQITNTYDYGNQRNSLERYGQTSYYLYDGRGSVSNLTSQTGENVVSYTYDIYGKATATAKVDNPYKYNAEAVDPATGLQYLRARYYDNSIGRFTTRDTVLGEVTNPLTQNLYTYCGNNPLNLIDPSGHWGIGDVWNGISSGVSDVYNNIAPIISIGAEVVGNKVNDIKNGYSSFIDNIANNVKNLNLPKDSVVTNVFSSIFSLYTMPSSLSENIGYTLIDKLSGHENKNEDFVTRVLNYNKAKCSGIKNGAIDALADIVKLPSTAVDLIEKRYKAQEEVNKQFNGFGTLDLLSGGFVGNIVYQKQQYEGIWNTVKNTFNDTILNGSSEERGNLTGEVIGNVTVGLAATEGLSALGSETELFSKVKVPEGAAEAVHVKAPQLPVGSEWERNVLNSFSGGNAVEKTYGGGTTLYRIGDEARGFWSLDPPPSTEFQWRVNNAIKQEFNNNMSNLYKIHIPEGSSIIGLDGTVGSQGMGLYGGAHQTYIDIQPVPKSWIETIKLK